jgi:hypothetical protein
MAAGLLTAAFLALSATANAGPYVNLTQPCDCPPNHYSAFHYITPVFYRWAAWCHGPCRYTMAKNYLPDVKPTFHVCKYHCPAANPRLFSLANYPGIDGRELCSMYPTTAPSSPMMRDYLSR